MREYWINVYEDFYTKYILYGMSWNSLSGAILNTSKDCKCLYRIHVKMKEPVYTTGREMNQRMRNGMREIIQDIKMSIEHGRLIYEPKYETPEWINFK